MRPSKFRTILKMGNEISIAEADLLVAKLYSEACPCRNQFCSVSYSRKSAATTSNYFVDHPPSVAQGGRGVVVPGCPACKKRINTMNQFLDHLAEDAMPALIEKLAETKTE